LEEGTLAAGRSFALLMACADELDVREGGKISQENNS
jgi:hypothetical protein